MGVSCPNTWTTALWACLIGGVLGNIIGFVGLPLFLFTVFDDMYSLPQMLLSYDIVSSLVSVALFAVGVVGATIIACRHEMAETPASLIRPKAPRAGSRISARAYRIYLAPHGLLKQGGGA